MTKRRREPESDGEALPAPEYKTVFVDTSLNTHLAMLASDTDTVLDFNKKLMQEHARCFPSNGEILIHSLKVKRRGNWYHLPDFMLVSSALHGVRGNWFLSADASSSQDCYINHNSSEGGKNDHLVGFPSYTNKTMKRSFPDGNDEENIASEKTSQHKIEKLLRNCGMGDSLEARSPARKKRMLKNDEDLFRCPTLENHRTLSQSSRENSLQPLQVSCTFDAGEEAPIEPIGFGGTTKTSALENHQCCTSIRDVVEGTSLLAATEKSNLGSLQNTVKISGLDGKEDNTILTSIASEDLIGGMRQSVLSQNVNSTHLERENLKTSALKKKKISKRRKHQLLYDQLVNSNFSSDYGKDDISLICNASDSENITSSKAFGISERKQSEIQTVKDTAAFRYIKDNDIKEADTGCSALEVYNAKQSLKRKISPSRNVHGNIKETIQPGINEEQAEPDLNPNHAWTSSENLLTSAKYESLRNSRNSDSNMEMEHLNKSKRKVKKSGGEICFDEGGKHSENVSPYFVSDTLKQTDLKVSSKESRNIVVNNQFELSQCKIGARIEEEKSSTILVNSDDARKHTVVNDSTKKKKKSKKALNILDVPDVDFYCKTDDSVGRSIKIGEPEKKDEEREMPLHHDHSAIPPVNNTLAGGNPFLIPNEIESMSMLLTTNSLSDDEIFQDSRRKRKKVKKLNASDFDNSGNVHSEQETVTDQLTNNKELEPFLHHAPIPTHSKVNQSSGDGIQFPPTTKKENQVKIVHPDSSAIPPVNNIAYSGGSPFLTPNMIESTEMLLTTKSVSDVEISHDSRKKKKKKKNKAKKFNATDLDNPGEMHAEQETVIDQLAYDKKQKPFLNNDPLPTHFEMNQSSGDCLPFPPTSEKENQVHHDHTAIPQMNSTSSAGESPFLTLNEIESMPKLMTLNTVTDVESSHVSRRKKKVKKLNAPGLDNSGSVYTEQETETYQLTKDKELDPFLNHDPIPTLSEVKQSSGDCLLLPPTTENEIQMEVDPNRTPKFFEKGKGSTKISTVKKKAKQQSISSDIPENMLTMDQNCDVIVNSNNEIASNEQENGQVDSLVLSHRTEEIHETAGGSNDPTTTIETQDEEINFQHYFLAGQDHDKVGSVDKVRKTSKSNEEVTTRKRIKKHALLSDSTSTEFQNSHTSYEKKASPDCSNNMSLSALKSLGVSGNGVNDFSPNAIRITKSSTCPQKKNPAATTSVKENNSVSSKSNLRESVTTPANKGTKRGQLNSIMIGGTEMKTSQKNSLLAKGGSIFKDIISESSGDENGNAISDASTPSPSDSSQSDHSEGEIGLNQSSTRNGSNDAPGRFTGKNNLNFKISAANELTMDMILRSSKRFKKAKFLASQNVDDDDSQRNEFVPDSQANQ